VPLGRSPTVVGIPVLILQDPAMFNAALEHYLAGHLGRPIRARAGAADRGGSV
jgi:hypothetical protein